LLSGNRKGHEEPVDIESEFIKRNQIELILEILKACREPVKRTHLIYLAKMNHYQLVNYLGMLQNQGMITKTTEPFRGYVISKKGRALLKLLDSSNTSA
jgi:predicted transcriptional regulator